MTEEPSDARRRDVVPSGRFAGWFLIAIGVIHVLATPLFYTEYAEPALWFVSGGIAFAAVGLLNLAALRRDRRDRMFCRAVLALDVALSMVMLTISHVLWFHVPSLLVVVAAAVAGWAVVGAAPPPVDAA
jgi:hypothetical protein